MAFRLLRGMTWLGFANIGLGSVFFAYAIFGTASSRVVGAGAMFLLIGAVNVVISRRAAVRLRTHLAHSESGA